MSSHVTVSCWSMLDAVRLRRVSRLLPALVIALGTLSPSAFAAKDGMLDLGFAPSFGADTRPSFVPVAVSGEFYYLCRRGSSAEHSDRIVRLRRDGTLDDSFQCPIRGDFLKVFPAADGGVVIVSGAPWGPVHAGPLVAVSRVDATGAIDASFHPALFSYSAWGSPWIVDAVVDSKGRIYVSGYFDEVDGQPHLEVVRLLPDGSVDPAFVPPVSAFTGLNHPFIALTPDEKLLVAASSTGAAALRVGGGGHSGADEHGTFDVVYGVLIRLTENGSVDPEFTFPEMFHAQSIIRVAGDGRIALVDPSWDMIRVLLPNGAVDESFSPDFSVDFGVSDMAWDGDKIVVGVFNSTFRLNADGSRDRTWSSSAYGRSGDGFGSITITRDSDGSWLLSGDFAEFAGVPRAGVARLQPAASTELTWFNTSARGRVTAADPLIVGFVVGGNAPQNMFVRGVGQSLDQFGITDTLAQPVLRVHRGETLLLERKGVSSIDGMNTVAVEVGAFPLGSSIDGDAADVIVLPPGAYTLVISSGDGTEGTALGEVYSLDAQ